MSSRFGYSCRKTRRNLKESLPDWNCNCGQTICINSINEFCPKGTTHAGVKTLITRDYYHGQFDATGESLIPQNIISQNGLRLWRNGGKLTKDHAFTPQLFGRLVMDNPDIYLADTEESRLRFNKLFLISATVIFVTSEENTILRGQTHNSGDTFQLETHTHLKYKAAGIKLLEKRDNETWKNAKPISNILTVPKELTEYETRYLTS